MLIVTLWKKATFMVHVHFPWILTFFKIIMTPPRLEISHSHSMTFPEFHDLIKPFHWIIKNFMTTLQELLINVEKHVNHYVHNIKEFHFLTLFHWTKFLKPPLRGKPIYSSAQWQPILTSIYKANCTCSRPWVRDGLIRSIADHYLLYSNNPS